MKENQLARIIVDSAIKVHKELGPGLLESAYKHCLAYILRKRGLAIQIEKAIPLSFEDVYLDCGYRIDILVHEKVVIEIKSVESLNNIHMAQILTYLKLGDYKLGFLINFNVKLLKYGIKRVINSKN